MQNNMITKAIIPVAGLGTRFLPATKAQPKEMLSVIDTPVIQFIVEEAVKSGITDIIFVTSRNKRAIEDHFDYNPELEQYLIKNNKKGALEKLRAISGQANFIYTRQKSPRGDGDSILNARHLIDQEPVAVMFGDNIIDSPIPCLVEMEKVFKQFGGSVIALTEVPIKDVIHYGIVKTKPISENIFQILDIIEKPSVKEAPSRLAAVGRYLLTPEIFPELKAAKLQNGELKLTFALKSLIKKQPVYGYKIAGKYYDCGSKVGFLRATIDFGLKHRETKNELKKYLRKIKF